MVATMVVVGMVAMMMVEGDGGDDGWRERAIYVTSLAAVEILRAREGGQQIIDSVDVTCGLSLGEYTALAFSEAFSFEDGLKLVKLRGEAMQEASDASKSAMVSVIGLDSEKVQKLCEAANEEVGEEERVQIANFLCPGNYAASGGVKGIEAVEAKAKSFETRMTVRLGVAGAFHTRFMEPAVSRLEAALATTDIRKPCIPVISNVDAQPHADRDTIKKILARQVTSPVQWETTVKTLLDKGLKKSYELGPGKINIVAKLYSCPHLLRASYTPPPPQPTPRETGRCKEGRRTSGMAFPIEFGPTHFKSLFKSYNFETTLHNTHKSIDQPQSRRSIDADLKVIHGLRLISFCLNSGLEFEIGSVYVCIRSDPDRVY
ncbi:hypothetical protein Droror1_Dr00003329 [Drosera rotundifolia]